MLLAIILSAVALTNLTQVSDAIASGLVGRSFSIDGVVLDICPLDPALITVHSSSEHLILRDLTKNCKSRDFKPGNHIRASGVIANNENGQPSANCTELALVSVGTPPEVVDISASELTHTAFAGKLVRLQGIVRQVFRDEIDPKYIRLVLADNGTLVHASYCHRDVGDHQLKQLVDAEIRLTGVYMPRAPGLRKFLGTITTYQPQAIQLVKAAPADPFDAPMIDERNPLTALSVSLLGRRKIVGKVIAVMKSHDILVSDGTNAIHRISFRDTATPSFGDNVEVVGYAETDLYRINLSDAVWRRTEKTPLPDDQPTNINVNVILTNDKGEPKIDPTYHGRAIRIRGTIMDIPNNTSQQGIIMLKSDGFAIPVDIAQTADLAEKLSIGCGVSVAGTCVIESNNWSPTSVFPQATGITLVVRQPEDMQILYQPPWWTPEKFLLVVLSLILILIAVFVWNRWLNRLVSRRSRALVREQLALAEAELKIGERTRLAIELHDSLSQNLAAVACQVSATKSAAKVNAEETMGNLNTVERMLLSCRAELRRCLWDLRNDAFDESNMTDVIHKVLAPVLGKAELKVRFNVPRTRLDDSTLHAIICIIRELTANAVVHGTASHVLVAGDLNDNVLSFSVREDGIGFDVTGCQGPAEGHFGLAGIRERVARLCGTFSIEARPGKGSYAKANIRLPSSNVED